MLIIVHLLLVTAIVHGHVGALDIAIVITTRLHTIRIDVIVVDVVQVRRLIGLERAYLWQWDRLAGVGSLLRVESTISVCKCQQKFANYSCDSAPRATHLLCGKSLTAWLSFSMGGLNVPTEGMSGRGQLWIEGLMPPTLFTICWLLAIII